MFSYNELNLIRELVITTELPAYALRGRFAIWKCWEVIIIYKHKRDYHMQSLQHLCYKLTMQVHRKVRNINQLYR